MSCCSYAPGPRRDPHPSPVACPRLPLVRAGAEAEPLERREVLHRAAKPTPSEPQKRGRGERASGDDQRADDRCADDGGEERASKRPKVALEINGNGASCSSGAAAALRPTSRPSLGIFNEAPPAGPPALVSTATAAQSSPTHSSSTKQSAVEKFGSFMETEGFQFEYDGRSARTCIAFVGLVDCVRCELVTAGRLGRAPKP